MCLLTVQRGTRILKKVPCICSSPPHLPNSWTSKSCLHYSFEPFIHSNTKIISTHSHHYSNSITIVLCTQILEYKSYLVSTAIIVSICSPHNADNKTMRKYMCVLKRYQIIVRRMDWLDSHIPRF